MQNLQAIICFAICVRMLEKLIRIDKWIAESQCVNVNRLCAVRKNLQNSVDSVTSCNTCLCD